MASAENVPRWKQREKIRNRSKLKLSGSEASRRRGSDDGCITGHPRLFAPVAAFELERMPEGGGYPVGFIELASRLLAVENLADVVHLCSGSVRAARTFDLRSSSAAAVRADVRELPIRTGAVRWVMADPPYGADYAEEIWKMGKQYPTPTVLLREIGRILAPGGRAAFLHQIIPDVPDGLTRIGTYGITTGVGYRIRALTIVERSQAELFGR